MSHEYRRIEEASFNAWPALQTVLYDGWVIRLAGGYTKRANSFNPTYPSLVSDLEQKVDYCESFYVRQGLPCIARLTSFGVPPGLDDLLVGRGYRHADDTRVMLKPLSETDADARGTLRSDDLEPWLDRYVSFSTGKLESRATHAGMLAAITGTRCFGSISDPDIGRDAACGLAVVEGALVGLFDIVTDPDQRQRGHGRALVQQQLAWAYANGARTAYLQVMEQNVPAVRLYESLGFATAYRYWYRIKSS